MKKEKENEEGFLKAIEAIQNLNFEMQKMKMKESAEGEGYSQEKVILAEKEYKRFLTLLELYPEKPIVPNKLMDTFWHYHILDTKKYLEDCEKVFGGFLHHFPYFGLRGEEDAIDLENAFQETLRLYQLVFNESMLKPQMSDAAHCKRACVSYCKRACKS